MAGKASNFSAVSCLLHPRAGDEDDKMYEQEAGDEHDGKEEDDDEVIDGEGLGVTGRIGVDEGEGGFMSVFNGRIDKQIV
ncbi:hypothetical protein ACFX2J_031252 [Malus domestica]